MIVSGLFILLLASLPVDVHAGESPLTRLEIDDRGAQAELRWADAEDVVRGTLSPFPCRVGVPCSLAVVVGSVQGAAFEGPVTLSLRPLQEQGGGESSTVPWVPGQRTWVYAFTPNAAGPHRVEVSFRTTRLKVTRGELAVAEAKLPRWLMYAVGGGLISVSIGLGIWLSFAKRGEGEAGR